MNTECSARRRVKLHTYFGVREYGTIDTTELESTASEARGVQAVALCAAAAAVPIITNGRAVYLR